MAADYRPPAGETRPRATPREIAVVLLSMAAVLAVQLTAIHGCTPVAMVLESDQWFTWRIASQPSLSAFWRAVVASEPNPPLYTFAVWCLSVIPGGASETPLRAVSLGCTLSAAIGLYTLLRRSFPPLVCAAALACFWSLPSVYGNAFEARYYAPWLACTVWFAWFVAGAIAGRPGPVGLAVTSILICAAYLLGVVTWALIIGTAVAVARDRRRMSSLMPALAGPVLIAPLLIWIVLVHGGGFEATSWNDPVGPGLAVTYLSNFLLPPALTVAALMAGISYLFGRAQRGAAWNDPGPVLLFSLAALPPVLLAVSTIGPPLTMERYAFPVVISTVAVAAAVISRLERTAIACCAVVWLGQSTLGLHRAVDFNHAVDAQSAQLVADVRGLVAHGDRVACEKRTAVRDSGPLRA